MTTGKQLDAVALLEGTTAGPWSEFHGDIIAAGDTASDYDDYVIAGLGKSTGSRSSVYSPVKAHTREGAANARLIASAPDLAREVIALRARVEVLVGARDTPEVIDFAKAVQLEAWHQRDRWGADHDAGKAPLDWFWLIGYLAQKAAAAQIAGDTEKALHHTISTASALANWHLALSGGDNRMRPGIETPALTQASETGR